MLRNLMGLFITLFLAVNSMAVPAKGTNMMIAAPSQYAVDVGKEIALKGGNVIDVAVAVGLSLAVTNPYFASFGGGGFALIKMGKDPVQVLDFREMAPGKTNPKTYLTLKKEASRTGGLAVGVPGVPAGLWEMHKKYGKLHWTQLFQRPIQMAQKGFRITGEMANRTARDKKRFNKAGLKHFFKKNGSAYKPGDLLKQKALSKVLKEMRNRNIISFYKGSVARDIVKTVQEAGGVITLDDMKNYKVRWLKPITTNFEGHKIYMMPPPSSGGVVMKSALYLMDKLKLKQYDPLSVDELHMMGEILSRSFRGRTLLGDPDFHKNPYEFILSENYLNKMAKSIDDDESEKLEPLKEAKVAKESPETTHYSVMDKNGNAIALTVTLNWSYGSAVVSNKYGIALNDEMDDFTTRPNEPNLYGLIQGVGNVVEPKKRPLSSMTPTLVEKNSKIVMSLGSPGGPRIISGVIQTLYRVLVNGYDMEQAILAPRIHHQFLPHKLFVDKNRFSTETIKELKKRDHEVEESWMGRVYGVRLNKEGFLEAAHDSRSEGAAGGY